MRKMMIVLAAIAMASATHAAVVKWSTGAVKLPGTTTNMSGSNTALYFYAENVADPWGSKTTSSGEGDAVTYTVAASSGLSGTAYKTGNATITPSTTYVKDDTAYAAVIITYDANNDGKIGVGDYYMTGTGSYKLEAEANTTKALTMGSWTQITASSGGGGDSGAPEPTSGLLLLVGAGILGLRRKQK